ncbi:MAG: DUF2279 domain-containing protein [bacterium]|nr:DUF2279 domain-containing protein [bacterium]
MAASQITAAGRLRHACLLLCLWTATAWGQQPAGPTEAENGLRLDRLAALGAGGAVAHWAGFRYFEHTWYQGQKRSSIRWLRDWSGDTYLHLDKGGHFIGGMVMSRNLGDALQWAGFAPKAAAGLGAAASWAMLFEVEMRDAYFADWGFSIPDFLANTAGASVPLMHALWPRTQVLGAKFSWWPSPLYLDHEERAADGRPHTRYAIDDYQGMTFWLTVAVEQTLPARLQRRWPDWLGLAVGYSARGMHGANVKSRGPEREYPNLPSAHPEVLLSLDYDVRRLPLGGWIWEPVKQQLNWLRFPAPAVRVWPDFRFYLLYL